MQKKAIDTPFSPISALLDHLNAQLQIPAPFKRCQFEFPWFAFMIPGRALAANHHHQRSLKDNADLLLYLGHNLRISQILRQFSNLKFTKSFNNMLNNSFNCSRPILVVKRKFSFPSAADLNYGQRSGVSKQSYNNVQALRHPQKYLVSSPALRFGMELKSN